VPQERTRRIVHVDMDAFYASIEQRDHPALRGRPVAVGRPPADRGVVAAASYEARTFGVHSAMSSAVALRLCPALVLVRPDFTKYRSVSAQVFEIFRAVTPLVEPLSLDEAYLDVTENAWGETLGMTVARRIKDQVHAATDLTASAGVAPNKFLAKIASGWKKPDGLTVVAPGRVEAFLHQLPVDSLFGVGPVTAQRLRAAGVTKAIDLRSIDRGLLERAVGSAAEWLVQLAHGVDDRPVEPDRPAKSSGSEVTYPQDLLDINRIREEIAGMARDAAEWLDRHERYARTVTIKVRYSDFTTITRSHSTLPATRRGDDVVRRALDLLSRTEAGRRPVRLLGVTVHNLGDAPGEAPPRRTRKPLPLFDDGDQS
jgi:DNA polymerase IV